ncbi:MAG: hypothetical protein Q7T63_10370 [Burkholderiaceae bacterium]|nr:hypothetical protein [Burkholderiaceae bacterium]
MSDHRPPGPGKAGSASDLIDELGKLAYLKEGNTDRLLGVAMAIAGELFVLKASHERLLCALEAAGLISPGNLEAAGRSERLQRWFSEEEKVFAKGVLEPFLEPDQAINATAYMRAA